MSSSSSERHGPGGGSGSAREQREEEIEAILGTKVALGPLELKQPLLRGELDDGLTEAQRLAEQAKERRLAEAAVREKSYRDRLQEFNKKLAKQTEHFEMPRISG